MLLHREFVSYIKVQAANASRNHDLWLKYNNLPGLFLLVECGADHNRCITSCVYKNLLPSPHFLLVPLIGLCYSTLHPLHKQV